MHSEYKGGNPALTKLRDRLRVGMARMRLNQTDLAQRAGLGRTTVSEALSPAKPAPSLETVAALSRALQLPVEELRELQRRAVEGAGGGMPSVPGRLIGEWDPHDLEVHPAGPGDPGSGAGRSRVRPMPRYVRREHDRVLAGLVEDATAGRSQAVVLVGGSSTGKTRACWEAVQPLAAAGWRLWHPFDPTRAQDALEDLPRVAPRTVVWLNEAQHYLGDRTAGEQIAAAVHQRLVTAERGPVLVLGTLWPEYATRFTALPAPGQEDPHSRVRELLAGRVLAVPEAFDAPALAAAVALAKGGDRILAGALARASVDGRVTQDLAGAPELLSRYQQASPAAAAVLEAAMDARRLGVGLHLPQAFLTEAATDYLADTDYDHLTDDWAEQAFAELAALVHGKQAPLRRTTPRARRRPPAVAPVVHGTAPSIAGPVFRLADYLEQHGRTSRSRLCPPASFWHSAYTHLTRSDDLGNLTEAAQTRHRLQWAHYLRHRAADHGNTAALTYLAERKEEAGDREAAEILARQAADRGSSYALIRLVSMREEAEHEIAIEPLLRQAIEHGSLLALAYLAQIRERSGDREAAEALAQQAAECNDFFALSLLAMMREQNGDQTSAERLARQAAKHGDSYGLRRLASMRERLGDLETAESLLSEAVTCGNGYAVIHLAEVRKAVGDRKGAESLLTKAADAGIPEVLSYLARERGMARDWETAEALARRASASGDTFAFYHLARRREEAGEWEAAERLLLEADGHGNVFALHHLACMRRRASDREGAESVLLQLVERGDAYALLDLAEMREEAGDREGAESLYLQAANLGDSSDVPPRQRGLAETLSTLWPHGLDPDGTPTSAWQTSAAAE
ncbi:helix-turn-helix domain-containing protein [Streptomyces sp. NPDC056374]|uniref:helix-turn-helix domain-containing protein n=1 Tax=unclassified Streptomyces TaxID=2593676 RepID=UPI0035DE9E2B